MDKVAELTLGLNLEVLKEPRGFIKILEFVLAIFAFATTTAHNSHAEFTITCNSTAPQQISYTFSYPFRLHSNSEFTYQPCGSTEKMTNSPCCDFNSPAEFYVFVGVMAFLYSLAAIVLYVKFDKLYREKDLIPIVDLIATAAFAVFFFIASCVWADGLSKVKYNVDPANLISNGHVEGCTPTICQPTYAGNFAGLNVSIIFGFLCMAVWGGNLWFLYKETRWFKDSAPSSGDQGTPQFSTPTVPSPDQGQM